MVTDFAGHGLRCGIVQVKGFKAEASAPVEQWKTWTFQEYLEVSRRAARAFMAAGVDQFDSVNVFGFNSPEWYIIIIIIIINIAVAAAAAVALGRVVSTRLV